MYLYQRFWSSWQKNHAGYYWISTHVAMESVVLETVQHVVATSDSIGRIVHVQPVSTERHRTSPRTGSNWWPGHCQAAAQTTRPFFKVSTRLITSAVRASTRSVPRICMMVKQKANMIPICHTWLRWLILCKTIQERLQRCVAIDLLFQVIIVVLMVRGLARARSLSDCTQVQHRPMTLAPQGLENIIAIAMAK
jgi:hypothetical protein